METISLIASVVSVIIGGFAIWLSVTFYKLSNKSAEETKEASKSIGSSVDRLEILFDRLYSDTFSMMKDTVSDMRKHMWPDKNSDDVSDEIEQKATEKINSLKSEIGEEISGILKQLGRTDSKIEGVQNSIEEIVNRAISTTRKVEIETQEEYSLTDVLNFILKYLKRREMEQISVRRLLVYPPLRSRTSKSRVIEALNILQRDGHIEITGPIDEIESKIRLKEK